MARRIDWIAFALSAVGGLLYFLGFAGFGIWPLVFVALVPLLAALERVKDTSTLQVVGVGFTYGFVTYAGGYHWMVPFFKTFSGYGWALNSFFAAFFFGYLALQFALFALLYVAARKRNWSAAAVTVPALLTVEWLFPLLFPTFISNGLHEQLLLLQIADLGGPMLISSLVVLVNIAVFETVRWLRGTRTAPSRLWVFTVLCFCATIVYGLARIRAVDEYVDEAPRLDIGIVQVNMGIFEKRQDTIEGHRRHLEQSRELERQHELDLLVWPESAYMRYLSRELPVSGKPIALDLKTPILFGGLSAEYTLKGRRIYNSAFLIEEDKQIRTIYDKIYLLAFGEYLPFGERFPILYEWSPNSGRFVPGSHTEPLRFGEWRISTPVCYEDVLPRFMRQMVSTAAPHLLVNLTNDAWFGDTQEPLIHLAMARFRSIEHRRFFVRSTNSGISAVVDPVGRILAKTGVLERANLVASVRLLDRPTFYALVGDWPAWISLAGLIWMLAVRRHPTGE